MTKKIEFYPVGTEGYIYQQHNRKIFRCVITKIEIKEEVLLYVKLPEYNDRFEYCVSSLFSVNAGEVGRIKRQEILEEVKSQLENYKRNIEICEEKIKTYELTEIGMEWNEICNREGCCGKIGREYTSNINEEECPEYYPECSDCGWTGDYNFED